MVKTFEHISSPRIYAVGGGDAYSFSECAC